jgi:hypothetical protein
LHSTENKGYQHCDNGRIVELESHREPLRPRPIGMRCSNDPLSKDEIDDKDQDHTRSDEYLCSNSNVDVGRVSTPDKSQGHCRCPCHTETEKDARHDELLSSMEVHLEDGHVCYCSDDEQNEEDGCDWVIEGLCRRAPKTSGEGGIWGV